MVLGNEYEIYAQPKTPDVCMYTHFPVWIRFLQVVLLKRPLQPNEFVFPRIGANGIVYPHDEMSHDAVQKVITHTCAEAHLSVTYTTHCFRRGGAQYRFIFAPLGERWSLSTIRWWGGWAEGESVRWPCMLGWRVYAHDPCQVDMLIRYLLDELTHYETSHRDALCPIPREADRMFNGDHVLAGPVSTEETRQFKAAVNRQFEWLTVHIDTTVSTALRHLSCKSPSCPSLPVSPAASTISTPTNTPPSTTSALPSAKSSSSSLASNRTPPGPHPQAPSSTATGTSSSPVAIQQPPLTRSRMDPPGKSSSQACTAPSSATGTTDHAQPLRASNSARKAMPIPGVAVPNLRKKGKDAWREAIGQWENPDASMGGLTLKDWPETWYTGDMKEFTASKRKMRQVVAEEFYRYVARRAVTVISVLLTWMLSRAGIKDMAGMKVPS
jgi:hypothetical protein